MIIDVSNPSAGRDGDAIVKFVADQGGAGLATAEWLPGSHIVRAFNAIGAGNLAMDAHRPGEPVGVPIAGDDPKAVALAVSLIKKTGFEPVLIGGLAKGKYLVPGTPCRVNTRQLRFEKSLRVCPERACPAGNRIISAIHFSYRRASHPKP